MVTRHWCAVAARVAASVAVRASEGTIEAIPIALGRPRIMTRAVTARRLNMHPVIMHMSRPVSSTQVIPSFPAAVGRTKVIPLLSHTHTHTTDGCPSLMRGGSACGSISGGTSKRRYNRGNTNCAREAEDNDEGSDSETIEYASSYNAHESTCFEHPSYPELSGSSRSSQSYTTN